MDSRSRWKAVATARQGQWVGAALVALAMGATSACAPRDSPTDPVQGGLTPSFAVHSGNLFLTSQAAVNAASGITEVTGLVIIQGNDITDLAPLSALASVGGDLSLGLTAALTDVDGLSGLTAVGGSLRVSNNAALTNLDGLSNLTSVGELHVASNPSLTNVDGLSGLSSVAGRVWLQVNATLTNIDGLSNLTSVGDLLVHDNAALTNVDGLSSLTSVGSVRVSSNAALPNIDGLAGLTSVGGRLTVSDNAALTNVDGLSNLTSVSAELTLTENAAITNVDGLSNLTSVGGEVTYVAYNAALTDIDGLSGLTSVAGHLWMEFNPVLTNVDGLSNLTSVGGDLYVDYNETLGDCVGLYPVLTQGTIGGQVAIGPHNATGCNSVVEILASVSPEEAIIYLSARVDDLEDSAVLNVGQAGGLNTKLDGAIDKLEEGKIKVAANLLNAFIDQVMDLIAAGELTEAQGQPLIDQALAILAVLDAAQ